jgi:hypothetical protein
MNDLELMWDVGVVALMLIILAPVMCGLIRIWLEWKLYK